MDNLSLTRKSKMLSEQLDTALVEVVANITEGSLTVKSRTSKEVLICVDKGFNINQTAKQIKQKLDDEKKLLVAC